MNYNAYEKPDLEDIEHYGVLGMKWGVRKNPQKAVQKASKKLTKLTKKSEKQKVRSDKYAWKSETAWTKYTARKKRAKSKKAQFKSTKYTAKAKKWATKMEKYLSSTKIEDLDSEYINIGRQYGLDMLKWGPDYNETKKK